jgi:hypothetical protein
MWWCSLLLIPAAALTLAGIWLRELDRCED